MHDLWKKIVDQVTSGRWIMTAACSLVFIYCSVNKIIGPVEVKEIIMMVVIFYFQKQSDNGNPKQS